MELTSYVSTGIAAVSFIALISGTLVFVRSKANVDALKEAVETYRTLAESYKATIEDMQYRIDALTAEVAKLKKSIDVERKATERVLDHLKEG